MTTHSQAPILYARTAIIVVALIAGFGFDSSTTSQTKTDQDGPVNVKYGLLFQPGELKIEPVNPADLPPLPEGYAALNNKAYRITTTAIVGGDYLVRFAVPSVTQEDVFRKLRIFHAVADLYDPDALVWNDVTESENTPPSFSTKTIYGQSEHPGVYVIAKLVKEAPPNTSVADLVVTTRSEAESLTAPSLINYTIKVLNQGPDAATDVGLLDAQSGSAELVSVEPSQGKCKPSGGHIVCKLGSIKPGEAITIAVKLKPYEGRGSFSKEGQQITHNAHATAVEKDPAPQNNEALETVLVYPDPNQIPSVTLNRPDEGALFIGPADITLEATAHDPDGSISKVEFFDKGKSLGAGTSVDGKNYVLTARGLSYGNHLFVAVATDNGGRIDWSTYRPVFVNGLSRVSVKSPAPGSLIAPAAAVTLTAVASHPSGTIEKVQFFADSRLLGEGSLAGQNTYSFNWKGPHVGHYSITAIAIDGSGIPTISTPVKFHLDKAPEVAITSPAASARVVASTDLTINANVKYDYGLIRRVDFYANGRLLGSDSSIGSGEFTFTWNDVPEGQHSLTAVAVNDRQLSGTSKPVTIKVERPNKNH